MAELREFLKAALAASPAQLEAAFLVLCGKAQAVPVGDTDQQIRHEDHGDSAAGSSEVAYAWRTGTGDRDFRFRDLGSHYEITYEGHRFTIQNTLGAKYLDYLLHHPNAPVRALELEMQVCSGKQAVRGEESIAEAQDAKARRDTQRELEELRRDLQEAEENDNHDGVERLKVEIRALQAASKNQAGIAGDAGERARDNVRKAIGAVINRQRKGNKHQKAFATHLSQFVSLGYEVSYNQPGGTWE
jgi:hypothetical protein